MAKRNIPQIDIIKGLAILCVLALHTMPDSFQRTSWALFHACQAVPVFMIVTGFVCGLSSRDTCERFSSYLRRRFVRLVVPFLLCWLASLFLGLMLHQKFGHDGLYFGPMTLLGLLPMRGPGNYYIGLIFQAVLVIPLLVRCFRSHPVLTLWACLVLDLGYEIASPHLAFLDADPYLHSACLLRYLFALGLGLWMSTNADVLSRHNRVILLGSLFSIGCLLHLQITAHRPSFFREAWAFQSLLTFFYPALLFMVGLALFPARSPGLIFKALGLFGIASYHIFLVQIVWFRGGMHVVYRVGRQLMSQPKSDFLFIVTAIPISLLAGVGWWYLERTITRWFAKKVPTESPAPHRSPTPTTLSR